jgi:hypothetical protein
MRATFKTEDFGRIACTFPLLVQSNAMKFTEILQGGQGKVQNMLSTELSTPGSVKIDFGTNFLNLFSKC